jgi:hypothetical protein
MQVFLKIFFIFLGIFIQKRALAAKDGCFCAGSCRFSG